jgi:hypothetical protein
MSVALAGCGDQTAATPVALPSSGKTYRALSNRDRLAVAESSFTLTIQAPPNAPRNVHVSAICLDCLAGGPPPSE